MKFSRNFVDSSTQPSTVQAAVQETRQAGHGRGGGGAGAVHLPQARPGPDLHQRPLLRRVRAIEARYQFNVVMMPGPRRRWRWQTAACTGWPRGPATPDTRPCCSASTSPPAPSTSHPAHSEYSTEIPHIILSHILFLLVFLVSCFLDI